MLSLALALGGVGFVSLLLALRGRGALSVPTVDITGEARGSTTTAGDARALLVAMRGEVI